VSDPEVIFLKNGNMIFRFKQMMLMDGEKNLKTQNFKIKNNNLVEKIKNVFSTKSDKVMDQQTFLDEFGDDITDMKFDENYDYLFTFTSKNVSQVQVLEKKVILNDQYTTQDSFSDFLLGKNNVKSEKNNIYLNNNSNSINTCREPNAHIISLNPQNIKIGLNGVMKKPIKLVILQIPECKKQKFNISILVKEAGVSFIGLLISNVIKDILFSFLNNKDVLDVVRNDHLPKGNTFVKFDEFFGTYDCKQFPEFYDEFSSFKSNTFVKSFFIKDYEKQMNMERKDQNQLKWLEEYISQFNMSLPQNIQKGLNCRYNLVFPEYMTLSLLMFFWVLYLVCTLTVIYHQRKALRIGKWFQLIHRTYMFWYETFMQSLLLVYFYNLTSFCHLLKLVKSVNFGLLEFGVLVLRGAFVTYPLFYFQENIILKEKQIEKKKKTKKIKKCNKKEIPTKNNKNNATERIKETNKNKKKNKNQDPYPIKNTFFKELPFRNIYASWIRKKNQIITYIRVSFKNNFRLKKKNKNELIPKKPIKKKPIIKKYVLEIVEPKKQNKTKKPKLPPSNKFYIYN
jgi:hypothetical protein